MVFRAKGANTFKVRVNHTDGRHAILTTGCTVRSDADDVELQVRRWEGKKGKKLQRLDVIDGLIAKRFTLPDAIAAAEDGTLEQLLEAHRPKSPEIDLLPLIDAAVAEKQRSKKGAGQSVQYKAQLLVLFPERPLHLSMFTRKAVRDRLAGLAVDAPTKNRYRTAASFLAKHLVATEQLDTNFVRDIEGFGENDPREVYFNSDDAEKLIRHLDQPYAAIAAAAYGFCMELTALRSLMIEDVTLKTDPVVAHVRGTKRHWRDRFVPLVPELAWTLEYLRPLMKDRLPGQRVFDPLPAEISIRKAIQRTAVRLKITAVGEDVYGPHTTHDWRRTHGVALTRWGYHEQIIADHEGHKNTTLVRENYGKFRSTRHDYAKRPTIGLAKEEGNG